MTRIEGWLPKIAIATFAYYCLTFAFELGYFWDLGAGYMSAFSIAEHAVHAASFIVVGLGVIAIAYFVALYPALGIKGESAPPRFRPPPKNESIHWTKYLSFGLILILFVATYIWEQAPVIARVGFRPTSLFGLLFSISFVAYFAMLTFRIPAIFCIYPAIIAAIIAPVALGQVSYDNFVSNKKATKITVNFAGKPMSVNVIFFGTDRMLVAGPKSPALVGYPDDAVVLR